MDSRVAVISIIVASDDAVEKLNNILHTYGQYIIGRIYALSCQGVNIICVAVDAPQRISSVPYRASWEDYRE